MEECLTPPHPHTGYIHSRVEEEYLWGCKQLGAYSPIVLLNTLLFFCTKYFHFRTPAQHHQLSFGHVMRCTRSSFDGSKTNFLRFYPPLSFKDPPAGMNTTFSFCHDFLCVQPNTCYAMETH